MRCWFPVVSGVSLMALALTLSSSGRAQTIIDQQNTVYNSYLGPSISPGQSFTPSLSGIDFATFNLATVGPSSTLLANLYTGDGFGGSLLASTTTQSITNTAFQPVTFQFPVTISLTPGSVYTLQLTGVAGAGFYQLEGSGDPYAGGVEYDSTGTAQTGYDTYFQEGTNTAAAPEPGSVTLLASTVVVAPFLRRSKRARKWQRSDGKI